MTAQTPTAQTPRLAPGELRRQVAGYLIEHAADAHTAARIATALNRSSGAVGKALETLADQGQAEKMSGKPVTYRATLSTSAAATQPIGARAAAARAVSASPAVQSLQTTVNGPVTRPNGQTYHPRTLAGLSDVTALRKLRAAGVSALLYGPPGTGKTSLIEAAFPDLITVAGDGDTAVADFIGEYVQTPDGRYEFVYGPLIRAMQEGRALLIDDATLISPKVLAVVYPAMDGRREIVVKAHKGETITAAEGFYVVAGHNPGVHGAILTEALSSRFAAQIQVSSDYDLAAKLDIHPKAVRVAKNLSTKQGNGEVGWAPQLRELLAFSKIAEVLGLPAAVSNLVGVAPEEDREVVSEVVQTVFGDEYKPLALGEQI
ncbi:AAA family ATPase [Actinomadura opuntiae]|uniref:AAA family ATPase n=1 Tax=Actinomadura sp. OS1-43 TaxID=604315 RepID=UPI00255B1302|nr:AAA family ATPase [Actinomadura sp. OS1-43]MDL4812757.1 AAA family ATPase [Actinomadura sp. OS1-43]